MPYKHLSEIDCPRCVRGGRIVLVEEEDARQGFCWRCGSHYRSGKRKGEK